MLQVEKLRFEDAWLSSQNNREREPVSEVPPSPRLMCPGVLSKAGGRGRGPSGQAGAECLCEKGPPGIFCLRCL